MRDIKFRAWHKTEKWMRVVSFWDFVMDFLIFTDEDKEELDGQDIPIHQAEVNACEIMQFTGLFDKNGKEIYEGDIVRYYRLDEKKETEVVCQWGAFTTKDDGPLYYVVSDKEVIGNIYENPELLNPPSPAGGV